jgi:hypothetical protein
MDGKGCIGGQGFVLLGLSEIDNAIERVNNVVLNPSDPAVGCTADLQGIPDCGAFDDHFVGVKKGQELFALFMICHKESRLQSTLPLIALPTESACSSVCGEQRCCDCRCCDL